VLRGQKELQVGWADFSDVVAGGALVHRAVC
jgi:hypothetical protein